MGRSRPSTLRVRNGDDGVDFMVLDCSGGVGWTWTATTIKRKKAQ